MPTKREREYYAMGFRDGKKQSYEEMGYDTDIRQKPLEFGPPPLTRESMRDPFRTLKQPKKRKLSAWNKYVKANSKKPRFRYRNGKLNLKKMAIAFRKTPAGRKSKRR